MGIALAIIAGLFLAELIGYAIHRLLHSKLSRSLSNMHMQHHLIDYPPGSRMRSQRYKSGASNRLNIKGLGLEWLTASSVALVLLLTVLYAIGVSLVIGSVVVITVVGWSLFAFNYVHDCMHIEGSWLLKAPIIKHWFKRARRLHDIHHNSLERQAVNFGISCFFFDRLFKTLKINAKK